MPTSVIPSFVIVGAGRVACAVGRALHARGMQITAVAGRDESRTQTAARFIGTVPAKIEDAANLSRHLLIAVSDDAIGEVAAKLAQSGCRDGIVLHTSGSRDLQALAHLMANGYAAGAIHPLQTIATAEQGASSLLGSYFAITGDDKAVAWATQITELLSGTILPVASDRWALYHAGAVMASNYQVALFDAALEIFEAAGIDRATARAALAPISRTTLDNVLSLGPEAALTGPIARGDSDTVRRNRQALTAVSAVTQRLYQAAGRSALAIAGRGGLASPLREQLANILDQEVSANSL